MTSRLVVAVFPSEVAVIVAVALIDLVLLAGVQKSAPDLTNPGQILSLIQLILVGWIAQGRIPWQYGQFFTKGQRMGTGQCPVKGYNRERRDLIIAGHARPSLSHAIISANAWSMPTPRGL